MTDIPQENKKKNAQEAERPSFILIIFLILPLAGLVASILMLLVNDSPAPPIPVSNRSLDTSHSPNENSPANLVNFKAPDFELTDLQGNAVRLADYDGKPVLINFWQTTCPPCVRELPNFSEYLNRQGEDGVQLIAINFDETQELIHDYFEEHDIEGIPIALDFDATVRRSYGVSGIPVTFAVDTRGIVRAVKIGEMTYDDMEQYGALISD